MNCTTISFPLSEKRLDYEINLIFPIDKIIVQRLLPNAAKASIRLENVNNQEAPIWGLGQVLERGESDDNTPRKISKFFITNNVYTKGCLSLLLCSEKAHQ